MPQCYIKTFMLNRVILNTILFDYKEHYSYLISIQLRHMIIILSINLTKFRQKQKSISALDLTHNI